MVQREEVRGRDRFPQVRFFWPRCRTICPLAVVDSEIAALVGYGASDTQVVISNAEVPNRSGTTHRT